MELKYSDIFRRYVLNKWNNLLYREGELQGEYGAEWFWDNFQIESAPKFSTRCWFHIPKKWGDDVSNMIKELRDKCPEIEFSQIKEKFCHLTVYIDYDITNTNLKNDIQNIIEKHKNVLKGKGLHP